MKHFLKFFIASQVLSILAVIFVLVVVIHKNNNTITEVGKEFLWHPILMALAFGYIFSTSVLVYRALRNFKKIYLKWLHAALHLAVIAFAIGGLVTTFDMHNAYGLPHLRSLHGLMGMITVIFFCIQWLYSFLAFLHPKAPGLIRAMIMPHHVTAGLVLYLTSLCAIVTGINEYNSNSFGGLSMETVLLNFSGFFFVMNALLVAFMALRENYRRQPIEEDHDDESEEASYG